MLELASMRPRVFPAEDRADVDIRPPQPLASMRPRVFPAEDVGCWRRSRARVRRFNEAAGIPRGRRRFDRMQRSVDDGFNEAAGIPRGRRITRIPTSLRSRRFNEAAGIPRGRRTPPGNPCTGCPASMRPRVFPAEDVVRRGDCVPLSTLQ